MKSNNTRIVGVAHTWRTAVAAATLFGVVAGAPVGPAAAASPDIVGTWRGNGTAVDANGDSHTVRCLVTFSDRSDGAVGLQGRCSTVAEAAEGSGRLTRRGSGRYAGTVQGLTYGAQGSISVRVNGSGLDVTLTGDEGQLEMPMIKVSD